MKSKSCCHDDVFVIRSDAEAFPSASVSALNPPAATFEENLRCPLRYPILLQEFDVIKVSDQVLGSPPIYLKYQVFRI
jgi:hypothetical protein